MRDPLFFFVFIILLYYVLKKPFIGVSIWLWISLMYPKGWLYGFAQGIRYNLIVAAITIVTYIFMKNKPHTPRNSLTVLVFLFLFWTLITSFFNIGLSEIVWADWIELVKIVALFFCTCLIIRSDNHINTVVWVIALSVGFYACVEGLKYIVSGGGHVLAGMAGHELGDRNDLAAAINMCIPFIVYLLVITKEKIVRISIILMLVLCVVSVLGSNSRGGFVGITVLGIYFWFKSTNKLLYLIVVPSLFLFGIEYMPESWHQRMATIEHAGEDGSFLGRIMAWKQAVLIALSNFTGGGFKAGQLNYNWFLYYPQFEFNWLIDTSAVEITEAKAAHSIYFQVLGDHGFLGLFIFLMILGTTFTKLRKMLKHFQLNDPTNPIGRLAAMLQLSLVTYMVAGAAVSLAYFDLLYMLFALTYVIEQRVNNQSIDAQNERMHFKEHYRGHS